MVELPSQRYLFAHRILPDLLWQGDSVLGILANPENQPFLGEQWDSLVADERCPPVPGREVLSYTTHWIGGDNLAVLIRLPTPAVLTEAHFACITTSPALRYILLEQGGSYTFLGEWTPGGHRKLVEGPAPDPEQFLHAVCIALGLPPTVEEPTQGQRQGLSRGGDVVHMGVPMDPADLEALKQREAAAESLEWDSEYGPAFEGYHAALQEYLARYLEPPTDVTLLYAGAVRCLKAMGQVKAAEAWARQWWTLARRFRMLGHAETMLASRSLAEIVAEQGRPGEAQDLYRHRALLAGLARGVGSRPHQDATAELERFTAARFTADR